MKETKRFRYTSTKPGLSLSLPEDVRMPNGKGLAWFHFVKGEKIGLLDFTCQLPLNANDKKLIEYIENLPSYGKVIKRQPTAEELAEIEKAKKQKEAIKSYVEDGIADTLVAEIGVEKLRKVAERIGAETKAKNKADLGAEKLAESIQARIKEIVPEFQPEKEIKK